jgi:hypothetical protein
VARLESACDVDARHGEMVQRPGLDRPHGEVAGQPVLVRDEPPPGEHVRGENLPQIRDAVRVPGGSGTHSGRSEAGGCIRRAVV